MQQPMYQEQQQGSQQGGGQQMLLCPVRLVYETQVLVQPGDQIQPNQTIFINTQNPPPWIQNRPQNQVIYVQQMAPNNYMPHIQQQSGQNQIYMHQNFNNYQQIMPQQIMPQQIISQTQQEEVRSSNVQMANMLSRNTVQSLQPGPVSSNPNTPNESIAGSSVPNFGVVPSYFTNQVGQNQISFIPSNVSNKNIITNVQAPPKPIPTNAIAFPRNTDMQQNLYRPLVQQTYQQENNVTPTSLSQSITMVPMQNRPTIQKATVNNSVDQNVAQIRPLQSQIANAPSLTQPTVSTVSNITNERIMRKVATVVPKGNNTISTLLNTCPKNTPNYSYRPIQPRPQQQRNTIPNIIPTNNHAPIIVSMQASNLNNNVNNSKYLIPTTLPPSLVKTEPNVFNRKRKSESPDEVQNKMVINNITQGNVAVVPTTITTAFADVGVNTMPIQKTHDQIGIITLNSQSIAISRPNEGILNIKDNSQRIENQVDKDVNSKQHSESEKLLRNTVFTQARNRVLSDKQEIVNTSMVKIETQTSDVESLPNKDMKKDLVEDTNCSKEIQIKEIQQPTVADAKTDDKSDRNDSNNEHEFKEINLLGNSKTNDEYGFVLTHVLDGYVIQESNIAFPIRKPLKEKTVQPNVKEMEVSKDQEKKEDPKIVQPDLSSNKIFNLSFLQLNEAEAQKRLNNDEKVEDCKDKINNRDNPFAEIKTPIVKTWTVEQLSTHLVKYGWDETVSVLREHEIDGESLFLVSKNQLMTIGVSEDHANVICEFVKS
ncbi:unnamed protein product [Parnassius apollo]|uniref:(apollo) hypothetical protein n=1 Tax=Parnassius apollo TaxID=110799 RepID=A0A8S3Y4F5_PARAO|nr:unnamed protein product [Parnassius apollo]